MKQDSGNTANPVLNVNTRAVGLLVMLLLAPVILLTILLFSIDQNNAIFQPVFDGFKIASALTLSFLGGMRWSAELFSYRTKTYVLALSFLPVLAGWISLFVAGPIALGILLIAVCAMGAWDSFFWYGTSDHKWFAKTRNNMTLLLAICHIAALLIVL